MPHLIRLMSQRARTLAVTGALYLLLVRETRAESSVTYKYEDYQEAGGRIAVKAQYALFDQTIGTDTVVKVSGAIDAITGATPTGQPGATAADPVMMTQIEDRRKAWTADFSRQIGRVNLDLGVADSRESDYVSNGLSLTTVTDFNAKNTALVLGVAANNDNVKVFYQSARAFKRGLDGLIGVNQLIDPATSLTFNLTVGRASGYLSDPYKIILKTTQILPGVTLPLTFPENRPQERNKWIAFVGYNHAVAAWDGAVDASYRFYHDSFGTASHTLAVTWLQNLNAHLILAPTVRYYEQSAADFYHLSLDGTSIVPGFTPNAAGPFFSADYRLSHLRTYTYGLKLVWHPTDSVQLDLAYDRYEMKGLDGLTSPTAYPRANTVTAGVRYAW